MKVRKLRVKRLCGGSNVRASRFAPLLGVLAIAAMLIMATPAPALATNVRAGQWQLDALNVQKAHKISTGSGVKVGLIGTGVDASHPDLAGQILSGASFGPGKAGSDDGKKDTAGHGTAMAGDIVAKGGGATHALGIAPGSKILPVRVSATGSDFSDHDLAVGIRWATDHGASVINVSMGAAGLAKKDLQGALKYAFSKDVVVVGSAGNTFEGQSEVAEPANYPGVVAVGGTSRGGSVWDGSVHGNNLALVAPADGVVSTGSTAAGNKTGYVKDEGTSDAAAFVSGAAALVRSKFPKMDANNVIERLLKTADDGGPTGYDPDFGFGRLDIVKALTAKNVPHVDHNPLRPESSSAPQAGAKGSSSAEADASDSDSGGGHLLYWIIGAVVVILLIVLVLVLVLVSRNRGKKQIAGPRSAPMGYGTPQYGQQPYIPNGGQPGGPPPAAPGQPPAPRYGAQPPSGPMPSGNMPPSQNPPS